MILANELAQVIGQGMVYENELMSNHTTFRIGGPADILACPETEEGFIAGLKWCKEKNIPYVGVKKNKDLFEMQECEMKCENCPTYVQNLHSYTQNVIGETNSSSIS